MTIPVVMPQLGESVAEGTVIEWLKQEGDRVRRDEVILAISTEKVDAEIPAPASGVLSRILVRAGEAVPVGSTLAFITEGFASEPESTWDRRRPSRFLRRSSPEPRALSPELSDGRSDSIPPRCDGWRTK